MSDPRLAEQIGDAALTKLNASLPTGMSAFLDSPNEQPAPTSGAMFEILDELDYGPLGTENQRRPVLKTLVKRRLTLHFECRAQGSDSVSSRKAVGARLVYVEQQLAGETFGGLATQTYVNRTGMKYVSGDEPHVFAVAEVIVDYQTLTKDPTKRS